jgi:hypothetical protein
MSLSVKQRGAAVATYRYIQVRLMETLAEWVPTTPEMEVKLLLGAHIWDVAQHADALGKRTYELRLPLQFSLKPSEDYLRVLDEFARTTDTARRLAGFYDVMLPALARRFRHYLEQTDSLMDAPTVRILERLLEEEARMVRESLELRQQLPGIQLADQEWPGSLAEMESAVADFVSPRPDRAAREESR